MRQNCSSCFKLWWQECLDLQQTCCTIYFTSENVYRRFYEHHEHACCCVVLQKLHQHATSFWCELFPTFFPRAAATTKATLATVMHWNLRERFFCHGAAALGSGWWCWRRHRCYYSCYSVHGLISHNKMAEEPRSLYDFIHFSSCATKVAF